MIRVLQITDTHILPDAGRKMYGVDSYASLTRVLEAATTLPDEHDIVVVTGDLAEDGSSASYARLRELLETLERPVYVIPGNHDSVAQMEQALLADSVRMERIVDVPDWRLVFLDSTVPGKDHGKLDESALAFLNQAIAEVPEKSVLVCLHHGPFSPCVLDGCQLHDNASFLDVLSAHDNARLVVSGHIHADMHWNQGRLAFLAGPSTFVQARHPGSVEEATPHVLDNTRFGFRTILLKPAGLFESHVHWVAGEQA